MLDVCRQVGIGEAMFYIWEERYTHLGYDRLKHKTGGSQTHIIWYINWRTPVAHKSTIVKRINMHSGAVPTATRGIQY